jgi:hypothetical protein
MDADDKCQVRIGTKQKKEVWKRETEARMQVSFLLPGQQQTLLSPTCEQAKQASN